MTKTYGIYSTDGKKLKNSDEILLDPDRFWGAITKSVLDRTTNNALGILLHPVYINNKLHWIVRESKKWNLEMATLWCKKMFSPEANGEVVR